MRKRILLAVSGSLAALLVLLAGFCAIFWGYPETADGIRQNSRIQLVIPGEVQTDDAYICFLIENHSVRGFWCASEDLILEKQENGEWTELEKQLNNDRIMEKDRTSVPAFSATAGQIYAPDYVLVVGALAPGEYRITQPLYSGRAAEKKGNPFYARGYFTVTAA